MRHVAGGEIGEVAFRQRLQRETRASRADRQHRAIAVAFQHDLRAIRQLAHDVVEHVGRNRGRSAGAGFGRQRFGHFKVEVGGLQAEARLVGADQHVAQYRDCVAAFDHAMNVAQRFQELRPLDGNLHDNSARSQVPEQVRTRRTSPYRYWRCRTAGQHAAATEPCGPAKREFRRGPRGTVRWRGWTGSARVRAAGRRLSPFVISGFFKPFRLDHS